MAQKYDIIALELQKIGMTLREAQAYLIILESGTCTIKKVVDATGHTRPTAYRIIKDLLRKELIEEHRRGSRSKYTAKSPDELLSLLHVRKRVVEEQERELLRIVSQLRQRDGKIRNSIITFANNDEGAAAIYDRLSVADCNTLYLYITDASLLNYEQISLAYEQLDARRGGITVHEILAHGVKLPQASLETVERHRLKKDAPFPFDHSLIVADHTTIVTKDDLMMMEAPTATELHRACLTTCLMHL